jgi:hypothetical protein
LELAYTIIKWTGTIVFLPFAPLSLGWGMLNTTVAFVRAFDAYGSGDRAAAIPLFIAGAIGLVFAGDGVRALVMGGYGLGRIVATKAGIWAWKKLDSGAAYQLTV